MQTLREIESLVDRLPVTEQQALLHHLETNLRRHQKPAALPEREQWMRRLDALRASIGPASPSTTAEQILAQLREE